VLLDTGGTAILRDAGVPSPPLRRGWRAGTPQYMAPELWAGRPHTVSTDIYAATGVLVDALTGRPPYLGTDLTGLGVQHTQGALPSEAVPLLARELVIRGMAKDPRDRPATAGIFRRDVEVAGTAFLGATWRDQGRAWVAVVVAERLADPVPVASPVEFLDDDDTPLHGVAIDTAADPPRPGGVGWKVWTVAAAAVVALIVMIVFAVQALGGPGVQVSPTIPPAPVITGPSATVPPAGVPTSIDTAGDQPSSPPAAPTAGATPTTAPNTMPVTIAPSPTATPTPTPSPSPTHNHHPPTPTPSPT
jgi:eukaryotic-like serine/threonine-protein kinase